MNKLQCRPELLPALGDLVTEQPRLALSSLNADTLRMLVHDALLAATLRPALAELAFCRALVAQAETQPPGPDRTKLMSEYLNRVGPAWDAAFDALGMDRIKA